MAALRRTEVTSQNTMKKITTGVLVGFDHIRQERGG